MTEKPERQNGGVAALSSDEKPTGAQPSATAETAGSETTAAGPHSAELISDQHSLKIEAAKAADPFFSGRKHYPALDGLRGLAILMVLLFHYAPLLPNFLRPILGTGWAGVQLFFVLSGFLITGILYDSKGQPNYFRNFYARRVLRIFPLYYGVLTVLLAALLVLRFGFPHVWAHKHLAPLLWSYQPWLWTYTANIQMAIHNKVMFLVGHFWTLCVEEQFYMVWPLLVFLCGGKALLRLCASLVVAALFIRLLLSAAGGGGEATAALTPCQMDSLAAGALVAVLIRTRGLDGAFRLSAGVIASASAVAWLFIAFGIPALWHASRATGHWTADVLYSVLATFFASLLALVVTPGAFSDLLSRILCWKPLRFFGKYSYGIYVYHFPIWIASGILLQDHGLWSRVRGSVWMSLVFVGANAAASVSIAYASYHLYEKHFLKLKKYFPERTTSMINDQ